MKASRVALVLACAGFVQLALIAVLSFLPSQAGTFGAPFPIGSSSFMVLGSAGLVPSSAVAFLGDLGLTALLLWLIGHFKGTAGVLWGTFVALLTLVLSIVMFEQLYHGLGFAGIPIPIATASYRAINAIALWFDCLLMACVAALALR